MWPGNVHVRRIAGEPHAGQAVLHDVERLDHHDTLAGSVAHRTRSLRAARTCRSAQMLVELKRPRPMRAPARRGLFPHLGKRFGEEYLPVVLEREYPARFFGRTLSD
jgi:hypothetical protein